MLATTDHVPELLIVRAGADRRLRAVVDVTIPIYNEEGSPRSVGAPAPRLSDRTVPAALADHHRRQREHRPARGASPAGWPPSSPACRPSASTRRVAAGHCARRGRRASAPVVAYMDVDLSTDLDALLPLVAPLVSGHSDVAIGTRLASGSHVARGPTTRGDLSHATTCCCERRCAAASPTRSAGSRPSAPTSPERCCRWSRTKAGSSTPSCWCWPSTTACASTRCPSTGSTTRTRGSTSSTPRRATCGASGGCSAGSPRATVSLAGPLPSQGRPTPTICSGQLVRFGSIGVVSTLVFASAVRAARRPARSTRRRRRRPRHLRAGEHRGQPPRHVRAAGADRPGTPLQRRQWRSPSSRSA